MNKKMFLVAILSVTLLTISLVAVAENVQKEIAPEEQNTVQPSTPVQPSNGKEPGGGQELSSPAFHETQFTFATNRIDIPLSPPTILQKQFVFVPTGGAELIATFSAVTHTGATQTLQIAVFDNGLLIPPGPIILDQSSDEDGFQARSFTFGKILTPGVHNITVQASGSAGVIERRSLVTEIEELP